MLLVRKCACLCVCVRVQARVRLYSVGPRLIQALASEKHVRSHTEASKRPLLQGSRIRNEAHDLARTMLEDCCSLATSERRRGVFVSSLEDSINVLHRPAPGSEAQKQANHRVGKWNRMRALRGRSPGKQWAFD